MTSSSPGSLPAGKSPDVASRWAGGALVALSAAGFASLAILAKLAYDQGLGMLTILSLRFTGAAVFLGGVLLLTQPRSLFPSPRKVLAWFALGAIGYAVQAGLFFSALRRIPASIASLLLYFYPVLVALLSWKVNRKPPLPRQWLAMAMALAGVALTISPSAEGRSAAGRSLDGLGVLFVLASAVWYAGYIILTERALRGSGALAPTAWILVGGCVTFGLISWSSGQFTFDLTHSQATILLAMVFFSTIIPIGAFMAGLKRVGPTAASLLSTLEPVFTVLMAWLVLGEALSDRQVAGGALVLSAVLLLYFPKSPAPVDASRTA